MRILVSGFEPFGGKAENPTAMLIRTLQGGADLGAKIAIPRGVQLDTLLLPVTFSEAFQRLKGKIEQFDPDVVLAFGQAGRSEKIGVERVAINCLDADIPDNSGQQPIDLPIDPRGPNAYFSTLPIRAIVDALGGAGVPAKISNTAGTYVCNFLFYRLMEMSQGSRRMCGFIHVPYHPSQGEPSLRPELLALAAETILATVAASGPRAP